ncbi:MAG: MBL fold metallo-hydrolase [Leptospiraceae bacterium]|nr:MBL fold metallo-hydrolase [Leptospiraceae bacterium]MCP5500053.1 MBL fold metallo-hydrolase [Leptospiraceae bacterium]
MRVIALGVNSAFATGTYDENGFYKPKWQSNFLIEFDARGKIREDVYRFVIDFGSDIRHALAYRGLKMGDIDAWYCSHPHADHIGGVEGIALSTVFNPFWNKDKVAWLKNSDGSMDSVADRLFDAEPIPDNCKPSLWGHKTVLDEVWQAAAPGLKTLQGVQIVSLETYFDVQVMKSNFNYTFEDGNRTWEVDTVMSTHVLAGTTLMPSYGLRFRSSDGKNILFPTDTLWMMPPNMSGFYKRADVIYQDCETGFKSGVHSHIDDIRLADTTVKKKCYLYHYLEEPEVEEGEFKGVLRMGDVHTY